MPLSCFYKKKYANLGDRGAYFDCIVLEEFESIGECNSSDFRKKVNGDILLF